jgi:hypothetical protein
MELEEEKIMVGFHQEVHKENDKSWHAKHIKKNKFKEGYMVLLSRPYQIKSVTDGGDVHLQELQGKEVQGMVNRSQLKLYRDNQPTNSQ